MDGGLARRPYLLRLFPNAGEDESADRNRNSMSQWYPGRKGRGDRRRPVQGRRNLRERPPVVQRDSGGGAAPDRGSRAQDHHVPTLPRLRGHAGAPAFQGLRPGRAQVRRDAGSRLRSPDGVQQRLSRTPSEGSIVRQRISTNSASVPPSAGCGSRSRLFPGGATFTITGTHGKSCGAPAIRRSGWCSTRFTCSCGGRTCRPSVPSRTIGFSSSRWRTRPSSIWITCPGAGITVASPARASCRSTSSCWPCRPRGSTAALARDLQRSLPRRLGPKRRGRRAAFPHRHARRTPPENRSQHRRPAESAAEGSTLGHRVHRVRHRREKRCRFRADPCRPRVRQGRRPSFQGGDTVASGRHQHRRECRQGGLRAFVQHHSRDVGLRVGTACGRCRGDDRPGDQTARPALPASRRSRRDGHPGGPRPRREPALFRRSQERARPIVGRRFRAGCGEWLRRGGAHDASITCRSRCTTKRC